MSDILSQSEIENLLASLASEDGGALEDAPAAGGLSELSKRARKSMVFEAYDFRRPDKFSRDQLRTLQMVHETFARLCTTNLSAYLRIPIQVELISLEQVPFEEYLRSLTQSVFVVLNTPPLAGQSVLEMEFPLMFTFLDRLLGGTGRAIERNSLTEIERPLATTIAERTLIALRAAWESILPLEPQIDSLETSAQFVQIAPPSDIVITVLMEARIGDQRGALSLCVPHMVIKPITPKLSSQKWIASSGKRNSPHNRQLLKYQLRNTSLEGVAQLGKTKMNVQQLLNLKPGDVLPLDAPVHRPIDLLIRGRRKFQGKPAVKNKRLVLTITDVLYEE